MVNLRLFLTVAAPVVLALVTHETRALAQQPTASELQQVNGWSFNVAPYLWLPTIHGTLNYNLPPALGGRLPTDVSAGPGDILSNLNFATMVAADAKYERFSFLTDFIYLNESATDSHIKSIDFFGLPPHYISRVAQTSTGTSLTSSIWTLAGGYTLLDGAWGYFDIIGGFRYLGFNPTTDYTLNLTITGPRGNGSSFGGTGSISGNGSFWNGIAGFRGDIRLRDTGLFIPYYFDVGAGGSNLTWQISSGLGYQTGWAAVSLTYRYLSFEQRGDATVKHLSMGGPVIMVSLRF